MEQWWRQLRWNATSHAWVAKTDELTIIVSEETYERHLKAYLASQGIERKTWAEIMRPAEEAWKLQCELVDDFHANLDYWLNCGDQGVWIYQCQETDKAKASKLW